MYVTSCINITLFLLIGLKISIYIIINILYNKIDMYAQHIFDAESFNAGTTCTIRELCEDSEARDNCCHSSLNEVN